MIGRSGDFLFRLTQATTTADLSPLHRPCAAHLDLDTHNHIELHLTFASPFRRGLLLYTAAITQGFFLGHSHQTTFHAPARTRRLREALHRTLISARISSSPWPSLASPILGCIWVRIFLTNTCDVRRRDTRAHSFSAAAYLRQRQGGRHATTDRGHMANHLALQGTFHAMVRFLSRGLSMDKQDGLFWLDTLVARRNMIIIHR